jgi:uncharacterized protein
VTTPQWPTAEPDDPRPPHPHPHPQPPYAYPPSTDGWPPQGYGAYPPPGVPPYQPPAGPSYPLPQGGPFQPPGAAYQQPAGLPPQYLNGLPPPPGWAPPSPTPPAPASADGQPGGRTHKWGFGAFLVAEATFLLASIIVPLVALVPYALRDPKLARDGAALPAPVLVMALAIPPLLAAAVGLYATKLRGNGPIVDLGLRPSWRGVGVGIACGVGGIFLTIPLGFLWAYIVGDGNANSAVGEVFDGLHMPLPLALVVFFDVWLIAPICEEILYRGLLWGAMERRRWNKWVILGLTTAVFALAHLEPLRAPLLLFIGLPIGLARLLSRGRLVAPIIAHQINNFLPALGLTLLLLGHSPDF